VKILEHGEKVAVERCTDKHDLTMITLMQAIERQAQYLGFTVNGLEDAKKCAQFRVDFDSLITGQTVPSGDGWSGSAIYHVKGSLHVGERRKAGEAGSPNRGGFHAHWQRTPDIGRQPCPVHYDSASAAPGQIGVAKLSVELLKPPAKAEDVTLSAGGPAL